ncbi:hypothetical protein C8R44DRAFT_878774 [Mycena epipterygia]|nr:hypothetical protein C8R44DRAFT_878774 [Mycena epipterygia]
MSIPLLLGICIPFVLSVAFSCIQIRWPHLKLNMPSNAVHNLMADIVHRLPDLSTAADYLHRLALHVAQTISGTIGRRTTDNSQELAEIINRLDRLEAEMAVKISALDHTQGCLDVVNRLDTGASQRIFDITTMKDIFQSLTDLTKKTSLAMRRLDELEADVPRQISDANDREAANTSQRLLDAARSTSAELQSVNGQVDQLRRDLANGVNGRDALRAWSVMIGVEKLKKTQNASEACSGYRKDIQNFTEALTERGNNFTELQGRVQTLSSMVRHILAKSKYDESCGTHEAAIKKLTGQSENMASEVDSAVDRITAIVSSMERVDDHVLNMTTNFAELYKIVVALREDMDTVNVRV